GCEKGLRPAPTQSRQAYQPRMRHLLHIHEFPKIGINGHQNAPFRGSAFEQRPITRVRSKIGGLKDIVALITQPLRKTVTGTPIDQKPHGVATTTASSVSRAITACA